MRAEYAPPSKRRRGMDKDEAEQLFDRNSFRVGQEISKKRHTTVHRATYTGMTTHDVFGRLVEKRQKVCLKTHENKDAGKKEAQILSKLRHNNVIHLHGTYEDTDTFVLVLEYFTDRLDDYLPNQDEEGLSVAERVKIVQGVINGLVFIHQCGVCHGDVNTTNVALVGGDCPKLCNFELATSSTCCADVYPSLVLRCIGEIYSLPPEVFRREPTVFGKHSSWQLGCLITEFLTGKPAFRYNSQWPVGYILTYRPNTDCMNNNPLLPTNISEWIQRELFVPLDQRKPITDVQLPQSSTLGMNEGDSPYLACSPTTPPQHCTPKSAQQRSRRKATGESDGGHAAREVQHTMQLTDERSAPMVQLQQVTTPNTLNQQLPTLSTPQDHIGSTTHSPPTHQSRHLHSTGQSSHHHLQRNHPQTPISPSIHHNTPLADNQVRHKHSNNQQKQNSRSKPTQQEERTCCNTSNNATERSGSRATSTSHLLQERHTQRTSFDEDHVDTIKHLNKPPAPSELSTITDRLRRFEEQNAPPPLPLLRLPLAHQSEHLHNEEPTIVRVTSIPSACSEKLTPNTNKEIASPVSNAKTSSLSCSHGTHQVNITTNTCTLCEPQVTTNYPLLAGCKSPSSSVVTEPNTAITAWSATSNSTSAPRPSPPSSPHTQAIRSHQPCTASSSSSSCPPPRPLRDDSIIPETPEITSSFLFMRPHTQTTKLLADSLCWANSDNPSKTHHEDVISIHSSGTDEGQTEHTMVACRDYIDCDVQMDSSEAPKCGDEDSNDSFLQELPSLQNATPPTKAQSNTCGFRLSNCIDATPQSLFKKKIKIVEQDTTKAVTTTPLRSSRKHRSGRCSRRFTPLKRSSKKKKKRLAASAKKRTPTSVTKKQHNHTHEHTTAHCAMDDHSITIDDCSNSPNNHPKSNTKLSAKKGRASGLFCNAVEGELLGSPPSVNVQRQLFSSPTILKAEEIPLLDMDMPVLEETSDSSLDLRGSCGGDSCVDGDGNPKGLTPTTNLMLVIINGEPYCVLPRVANDNEVEPEPDIKLVDFKQCSGTPARSIARSIY